MTDGYLLLYTLLIGRYTYSIIVHYSMYICINLLIYSIMSITAIVWVLCMDPDEDYVPTTIVWSIFLPYGVKWSSVLFKLMGMLMCVLLVVLGRMGVGCNLSETCCRYIVFSIFSEKVLAEYMLSLYPWYVRRWFFFQKQKIYTPPLS